MNVAAVCAALCAAVWAAAAGPAAGVVPGAGPGWEAFDFGPAGSPPFASFTAVSKDDVYRPERGYGWMPHPGGADMMASNFTPGSERVPGLNERDRARESGACGDSLYGDLVMTSAYYHSQVRQTFLVDLPNGAYRVVTFHGDPAYGRAGTQSWWIEAEGRRVVENFELPRCLYGDAVFDVEVTDGQLTLTFDAAHPDPARKGFTLNGLAILPAATPAQRDAADGRIAAIRAAVQRERDEAFAAAFSESPYVEDAEMPPVSAEDTARGFVPFVPHWMDSVYPNTAPRPGDLRRPLACFACPGEFEPVSVALRALAPLDVSCSVSDLVGADVIPASAVDIRAVKCWPQRLGSSWSSEWRVMPELLEPTARAEVPADTTQQFWLTIHLPENTRPGLYRGIVALRADAGAAEFPLTVEALPFALQPSERAVGMYWKEADVLDTPLRDVQVRDMVRHGMTTLTMGGLSPAVINRDGALELDTGPLQAFLRDLLKLGIKGPIPYLIPSLRTQLQRAFPGKSAEDYDALYLDVIRRIQAVSARPDTPELLYYPVDEIGNNEARGRKAHDECALIAQVPGATSYITVNNYQAGEKWGDTFDIWCGNIEYSPEQEARLLERGKRYMRYGSAYLNDPRKVRTSTGFGFYRRPAEAMFYWHYQCPNGDPFNDLDSSARDWCAAYPGPDNTVIPTIDWEGIREGVDDLKYIATLKHYAERAGGDAADRARNVLDEVLGGDDRVSQTAFRDDLSHDAYHALRRRLVDAILELQAAAPGP
ncbi:MAG: DUF4091 domain-containing protein [Candidatus Hydrogenedentes bacterium]|nr:DUF4091 domain-containing protein [Candidatus Hydrogenedentota bacterium]